MKPKKITTKMRLNKTTIAQLRDNDQGRVVGGAPSFNTLCETWGFNSCDTFCLSNDPPAICQDPSFCGCGTLEC